MFFQTVRTSLDNVAFHIIALGCAFGFISSVLLGWF
jgi:hypothetical protein